MGLRSVYVTGLGIVSAIGNNLDENYQSLQSAQTGIGPIQILPFKSNNLVGEVKLTDSDLIRKYNLKEEPYSRTSLLGIAAAVEAWGNNQLNPQIPTGFISASSVGGMDKTEIYYRQVLKNEIPDTNLIVTHDSGNTSEKIASHIGIKGYINTISTACSSGANAIMLAARLIQSGKFERMLVGGTDALADFTIKGFHSLMIYDSHWCKPFDENRVGLNLGEGAGFLVLESKSSMDKTGNSAICGISGWHNAADAYHQTASSPEGKGASLAMEGALKKAGLSPSQISYINAHGTGTKNNDLSESTALKNVFGSTIPPFSSTKAFTGHTLAAAGAIEAVFAALAIKNKVLFPNLNFSEPIAETQLIPQSNFEQVKEVSAVLSNSFGFGGNNTSLIFHQV